MTYRNQTFSAGNVLTSQQLNQFEENIADTRTQNIGNEVPPELQAGVMWIDDAVVPWSWQIYDGTDWREFAKINPDTGVAWSVEGEFIKNADNPVFDTASFNVATDITESTWESVGPTGSGADNIWNALDDIPLSADWVEIRCIIQGGESVAADGGEIKLWARRGGSSLGTTDPTLVAYTGILIPSQTNVRNQITTYFTVGIDESNIFDLHWEKVRGNIGTIINYCIGYGFNR